jgi:hypothetical protein
LKAQRARLPETGSARLERIIATWTSLGGIKRIDFPLSPLIAEYENGKDKNIPKLLRTVRSALLFSTNSDKQLQPGRPMTQPNASDSIRNAGCEYLDAASSKQIGKSEHLVEHSLPSFSVAITSTPQYLTALLTKRGFEDWHRVQMLD